MTSCVRAAHSCSLGFLTLTQIIVHDSLLLLLLSYFTVKAEQTERHHRVHFHYLKCLMLFSHIRDCVLSHCFQIDWGNPENSMFSPLFAACRKHTHTTTSCLALLNYCYCLERFQDGRINTWQIAFTPAWLKCQGYIGTLCDIIKGKNPEPCVSRQLEQLRWKEIDFSLTAQIFLIEKAVI